ncbi:MAG TPA: DUF4160 domain-containing protein [Magnetococcales bacterium]|nr:DUF4160 domain-containing protein [Magnetococcales bacterium]
MPTISVFYGICIRMFFDEHAPPHFHAHYGEFRSLIDIRALEVIRGDLPRRARELVLDWAELHQEELLRGWELCQQHKEPFPIEPLR